MPPKTKKQKLFQLRAERARDSKTVLPDSEREPLEPSAAGEPEIPAPTASAADTDSSDESFDPDQSMSGDAHATLESFVEDWTLSLGREDIVSLSLFLSFHLMHMLNFTSTKASEYAAIMIGKGERTVRRWRADFMLNGSIPDSQQGHYQRSGVLWSCESLNKKATTFVRANAHVKGRPNLTTHSFCQWINETLLPNESLEPGFPRRVSVETARRWLHELGFETLSSSKGLFFDGHEREDVVEARGAYLLKMAEIGFLHPDQAPTPESARAFPTSIPLASTETREKTVVFFHDESTFMANEGQTTMWGKKGEHILSPKSKGSGIMVSDFVDERCGYLSLTDDEFSLACLTNPNIRKQARQFLEYGESREGYWTSAKFMCQMEAAVEIAEVKYPKTDGWQHVWVFDQSSCHRAMADDALDASKMNVNPGGKQPLMRETVWAGQPQSMVFSIGVAKGMKKVLQERGINTESLNGEQMRIILANHDDFRSEKPKVIRFLVTRGHTALFLPKFHPEINPIERVWAQSKRYTKAYCKYTLPSLRSTVPLGLDSVTLENIQNFHRKCRHYMFAYLEGHVAGSKLEEQVKKYKVAVKSHRRIGINE